jgi:hypothetical protein
VSPKVTTSTVTTKRIRWTVRSTYYPLTTPSTTSRPRCAPCVNYFVTENKCPQVSTKSVIENMSKNSTPSMVKNSTPGVSQYLGSPTLATPIITQLPSSTTSQLNQLYPDQSATVSNGTRVPIGTNKPSPKVETDALHSMALFGG